MEVHNGETGGLLIMHEKGGGGQLHGEMAKRLHDEIYYKTFAKQLYIIKAYSNIYMVMQ